MKRTKLLAVAGLALAMSATVGVGVAVAGANNDAKMAAMAATTVAEKVAMINRLGANAAFGHLIALRVIKSEIYIINANGKVNVKPAVWRDPSWKPAPTLVTVSADSKLKTNAPGMAVAMATSIATGPAITTVAEKSKDTDTKLTGTVLANANSINGLTWIAAG